MASFTTGPMPDLTASRKGELLGIEISFLVLSLCAVTLRLIARRMTKQKLWWDNHLIIAAWWIALAQTIMVFINIHQGLGKHLEAVGLEAVVILFKNLKAHEFIYPFEIAFCKISVLLYFWRIFHVHHTFRPAFWTLIVLIVLWFLACEIVPIVECSPFNAFWNRLGTGHCISSGHFYTGVTIPNLITDGLIWILPLFFIFHLQLSWAKKIGLTCAFGVGSFVMVVSGLRLRTVLRYQTTIDPTWDFIPLFIWTSLEEEVAIICACLPSMTPLLRASYRKYASSRVRSSERYYDASGGSVPKDGESGFARLTDLESNKSPSGKPSSYEMGSTSQSS